MTPQRYYEIEMGIEAKLTTDELAEGWHFCPDWDGMLVNKFTSPERHGCGCAKEPDRD